MKNNYTNSVNQFEINASTLRNRYLGIHDTPQASYNQQMILTAAKEEVMMEWMFHHAEEGHSWSNESIRYKVEKMTGRKPSLDWVKAFRRRHNDELKVCGASGLDPKRPKAFNPQCIAKQFKQLGAAFEKYRYKVWNIYNFDETGMQTRGGRKHRKEVVYLSPRSSQVQAAGCELGVDHDGRACCCRWSHTGPGVHLSRQEV